MVTVAGQSSTAVQYDYQALVAPPVVAAVRTLSGSLAGGTLVELEGTGFGTNATVFLFARDRQGVLTGDRLECVWRGIPGVSCTNDVIRCLSPPADGAVAAYDIVVETDGLLTTYAGGKWSYFSPNIATLSPSSVPASPPHGTNLSIVGTNFGSVAGAVTVGGSPAVCPWWTDSVLTCVAPPGASRYAVQVLAASGKGSVTKHLTYRPPVVTGVSLTHVPTRGGVLLTVLGAGFGSPVLPVSVWLVQGSSVNGAPRSASRVGDAQEGTAPWELRGSVLCPVTTGLNGTTGSSSSDSGGVSAGDMGTGSGDTGGTVPVNSPNQLSCAVPPGAGVTWFPVAVNQDPTGNWRTSGIDAGSSQDVFIDYLPPRLDDVQTLLEWSPPVAAALAVDHTAPPPNTTSPQPVPGRQPARGGFPLLARGANFGPSAPTVTVGGLPCPVLASSHEYLVCQSPARVLGVPPVVRVEQAGQLSGEVPFAYDAPRVEAVQPRTLAAVEGGGETRPALLIRGVNFGVRYAEGLPTHHSITVGQVVCDRVVWVSDDQLGCSLPPVEFLAGPYPLVVNVSGSVSAAVTLAMACPVGTFGGPGEACQSCPQGAFCTGGEEEPRATPGYYPLGRTQFVQCTPLEACLGGTSAVAVGAGPGNGSGSGNGSTSDVTGGGGLGCSRHYTGSRCGACAPGAYRLRGECKGCPNTAWLLFVSYPLGILGAVLVAMYLSKKRINMSGLSLGVVRASAVCHPSIKQPSTSLTGSAAASAGALCRKWPANLMLLRCNFTLCGLTHTPVTPHTPHPTPEHLPHQDFLQVLSMFASLDMHWPPSVKDTYNAVSLVNFNLELTAPECSVSLGYEAKWYVRNPQGLSASRPVPAVVTQGMEARATCVPVQHHRARPLLL